MICDHNVPNYAALLDMLLHIPIPKRPAATDLEQQALALLIKAANLAERSLPELYPVGQRVCVSTTCGEQAGIVTGHQTIAASAACIVVQMRDGTDILARPAEITRRLP